MKQLKLKLFITLALMAFAGGLLAQRVITGTVTDAESGEPLIGATVLVVGSNIGTSVDANGQYSVRFPNGATQIKFVYTGYEDYVVTVGATNVIDVQLKPGADLGEVLVIGYGTVKKEDATGALLSVKPKDFNKGAIVAPQELIAGKIAGVSITPSPDAGGGGTIRIRGGSSLSASNDPLIIIDGVPVSNNGPAGTRNPLNIVNPNDIESITVLKDASATAIYGSRASNGVIIITTKKGSLKNKLRVDYSGLVSFSQRMNQVDVLDGDEFRTLINERYPDGHPSRALLGTANTDWQDEIYQTGISNDHSLSVSGGIGDVPYRVALGYTGRTGILKNDKLDRLTAGLNLNPGFLDNTLQLNVGAKVVSDKNVFANRGAIGAAVNFDPTQPITSPGNEAYGGYTTWKQANGDPNPIAPANPLALLEQRSDEGGATRFITNASIDYRMWFLPDLRANLNLAYDKSTSDGTIKVPANAAFAFSNKGENREYTQEQSNSLLEFYLNYVKKFNAHKLDVMGGYSWQRFFLEDYVFATNADGSKELQPKNYDPREYFLLSLFGRLNYSFQDRYLLTFTLRRDGSSRFSEDNRWGLFPSVALGVKVVDNNEGALNSLKVRVSYGETGQQDIGNATGQYYAYLPTYLASQSTAQYQFGSEYYNTLRPGGYDENIKWETTRTLNAGIDYGMFDGRVFGSLEVYQRKTFDLLNYVPVPAGTNLTNFITTNVGDLQNTGVEFSVNFQAIRSEKANWEVGANVTFNKNEVTKLIASDDPNYPGVFVGGISGGVGNTIQIHNVGFAANSFYVYEQVYDEQGKPIEGLYVDQNGDGRITGDDRREYKNPAPQAFFGFYSNYTRGAWDFSFAGRANVGNFVYNNLQSEGAYYNRLYNSSGYVTNVQSDIREIDFQGTQYFSDHYIQNASFLRLDHITLGYTLSDLGFIKNLRFYGSVQNPFVITQYKGLDPEVFGGIDNNVYPRSRTYVFGVNAGF